MAASKPTVPFVLFTVVVGFLVVFLGYDIIPCAAVEAHLKFHEPSSNPTDSSTSSVGDPEKWMATSDDAKDQGGFCGAGHVNFDDSKKAAWKGVSSVRSRRCPVDVLTLQWVGFPFPLFSALNGFMEKRD